jgi:hypothetical protein
MEQMVNIEKDNFELTVKVKNNTSIEAYLSIVSLGVLECLKKNLITCDDAMNIIFFPGMIDMLEKTMPKIGEAVHLGTELEDVLSLIPERFAAAIDEIGKMNCESIIPDEIRYDHIQYKLKKI